MTLKETASLQENIDRLNISNGLPSGVHPKQLNKMEKHYPRQKKGKLRRMDLTNSGKNNTFSFDHATWNVNI